jgi:hypothetical protein
MPYQNDPMKCLLGESRCGHESLVSPRVPLNGGEPKYSVTFNIPKSDIATKADIDTAINAAAGEALGKVWGGVRPAQLHIPIYDGDGVRPSGEPFSEESRGC